MKINSDYQDGEASIIHIKQFWWKHDQHMSMKTGWELMVESSVPETQTARKQVEYFKRDEFS